LLVNLKERQFQDSRRIEEDLQELTEQIPRWNDYTNKKQNELIELLMSDGYYLQEVDMSDIAESLRDLGERLKLNINR
jgi:hypothetical protein